MAKTLLEIVQAVQGELGLPIATTAIGNSDATTQQLVYLSNRVIDELRRENPTGWQVCQFEYNIPVEVAVTTTGTFTQNSAVITTIPTTAALAAVNFAISADGVPSAARILSVDSLTQVTMTMEYTGDTTVGAAVVFGRDTYPMPSDYDWTQNQTHWDRTNQWSLIGPDSPQIDQWHRSGIVTTGPRRHWRQAGPTASRWRIWPPPFEISEPVQLVFEYMSLNSVAALGGATFKQYFDTDTDQPLLDDQAVITGMKWAFWEIKGFNVVNMQSRWVDYVQKLIARDGASPTLRLAKTFDSLLLSPNQVQDGNWPGAGNP